MARYQGKEINVEELKNYIERFMDAEADFEVTEDIMKHGYLKKEAISWSLETLLDELRLFNLEFSEEEIGEVLTALIRKGKIMLSVAFEGYYPPVVFFKYLLK